jgi:hypothetical protein
VTDTLLPAVAAACLLGGAVLLLNPYLVHIGKRRAERSAYFTALHATESELDGMTVAHLLDLRVRLDGYAEREQERLDSSIAAALRLDRVIIAKDTARRLTGITV